MNEPTKAPWHMHKLERDQYHPERYVIYGKCDDNPGVDMTIAIIHHTGFDWETFDANAHLIKQAPYLNEFLKQFIDELAPAADCTNMGDPAEVKNLIELIRDFAQRAGELEKKIKTYD